MNKVVTPHAARGMNMSITLNLFGIGPKWVIKCGECKMSFKHRIPIVDNPTVQCPNCKTLNELPLLTNYLGEDD
jgi:hypothetical protein